jgi:GT2 family glycosyltransferase
LPSLVVLSATEGSDIGSVPKSALDVQIIYGSPGSSVQRNRALSLIEDRCDIVVFFDDDFAPSPNWIEQCVTVFREAPEVIGVSGSILRDGAQAGEISWDEAEALVQTAPPQTPSTSPVRERAGLYGCNMAFRMSAIQGLSFDERLVRYGWLEDRDFCSMAKVRGRLVQCASMAGVHLGLRSGRVSGRSYGYSQVVNPWYLQKKGTLSSREAWSNMMRALAVNGLKRVWPEPHIDRRGRFNGNLIGVRHLLCGRCRPEIAAEIQDEAVPVSH